MKKPQRRSAKAQDAHLKSDAHRRELLAAAELFEDSGVVKPEIREAVGAC
jgi:hypothetical protein